VYLKSLTLKGFKSFAQPTTFAFEKGVTCVVGPNGSGKSNVVDALAWVMGEQGAKTLRGGKMEDVIFAGTATRGPLGRAEVSLTIDNSDGALPIEYTEVTISRTLFRNGTSEYAINGETCRLLDLQELLSDSGLGREMHVIVGQGRLESVLQASPEDRRGFIEEAAGILKHRRRKEKTVRKLEAMQANLTRLSDLAGEVRRQLKPLGAQADIAREAVQIQAEVRDARARLLADDVVTLRMALEGFNKSESERHSERIVLQEQLERVSLRVRRIEAEASTDAVDEARRNVFALESVQERLRGLFTLANQRLALFSADADQTPLGSGVTQSMVDDAATEAVSLAAAAVAAEAAWQETQELTTQARSVLDAAEADLNEMGALVSRAELDVAALRGARDAAQSSLDAVTSERQRAVDALAGAVDRRAVAEELLASLEGTQSAAGNAETLGAAYTEAEAAVVSSEAALDELRERVHSLEREAEALTARISALALAMEHEDGSAELVAAKLAGIAGLVAEHVSIEPGCETAIAAALGGLSDAVLADSLDAAVDALGAAEAGNMGRVNIIVGSAATRTADLPSAPGVVTAASVVTGPSGVLGLLAETVIADDLDAARAAWKKTYAPLERNVTIITRAGEVLTRFVLSGGSGATRSRIELVAERDAAISALEKITRTTDAARLELADRRADAQVAKERSVTALAALREFDAQLAARSEEFNRAKAQAESAAAEVARLTEALAATTEQVTQATAELERSSQELAQKESAPLPVADYGVRERALVAFEAQREREVQARLALETARERVRAEELRVEGLRSQLETDRQAAEESARRAVERRRQVDVANSVVADLPPVLDSVDRSVSEARVVLQQRETERLASTAELTELRAEEVTLREKLGGITESVHGLELQIYEKKLQVSTLVERAATELGLVEDVLVAEYGPDQLIPGGEEPGAEEPVGEETGEAAPEGAAPAGVSGRPFVRDEQERRLEKADRKLSALGRVNPLALEEFAALEARHQFLTEQLTDLTNTRRDLLSIIDEVDATMQTIFEAAFEDTRKAFNEVLPVLFPGGSGAMALTTPDDLLASGVEVTVKPAGKKIERLSLLSGGEKSLAAVAFLMAIFKARPSPFYILDEVEAALDDANLGRLLTTFEDLRTSSQLIIITHQKRTMEIADALYGVSMRQDGVSAVVGQRVAQAEAS
jgi:chromosome segregation protein